MYNTARSQDLEINSWVDERRDPVAATEAACRFLKRLHEIYEGDWHLALATYNAGPGNVNKAIRRSGSRDFWKVRRFLPARRPNTCRPSSPWLTSSPTRWRRDWFRVIPAIPAFALDTVMVQQNVRFDRVARATGRSVAELAQLNPQYRKEVVPGAIGGGWPLVLPVEVVGDFITRIARGPALGGPADPGGDLRARGHRVPGAEWGCARYHCPEAWRFGTGFEAMERIARRHDPRGTKTVHPCGPPLTFWAGERTPFVVLDAAHPCGWHPARPR